MYRTRKERDLLGLTNRHVETRRRRRRMRQILRAIRCAIEDSLSFAWGDM
jgi:hypothetical protein